VTELTVDIRVVSRSLLSRRSVEVPLWKEEEEGKVTEVRSGSKGGKGKERGGGEKGSREEGCR